MTTIEQPKNAQIRELTRAECETILGRNHVGRVAFSFHDHVDIEPIHYVYRDSWIYFRTSAGSKLDTIARHKWVAFEVDEIVALLEWRSVVVKGSLDVVDPQPSPRPDPSDTSARQNPAFEHAVALLREMLPETLLSTDPTPFRHTVVRIHLDEVSGRQAGPIAPEADKASG